MVLIGRRRRAGLQIKRRSGGRQLRAGHVASGVVGRCCSQTADFGRGDIVSGVIGVGILRAIRGGVARQVDAVGGIRRALRAGSRLRRGNGISVVIVTIRLRGLHPQGDVVKIGSVGVIVVGCYDDDLFDDAIFVRLAGHHDAAAFLPVGGIRVERKIEHVAIVQIIFIIAKARDKTIVGAVFCCGGDCRNAAGQCVRFAPAGKQERRACRSVDRDILTDTLWAAAALDFRYLAAEMAAIFKCNIARIIPAENIAADRRDRGELVKRAGFDEIVCRGSVPNFQLKVVRICCCG